MNKEELRVELEKIVEWAKTVEVKDRHNLTTKGYVELYLSSLEPKQPELKGISEAFQNFTNELKNMGL